MKNRLIYVLLLPAIALLSVAPLHAQSSTGAITGHVRDGQGLAVVRAAVTVTNVDTHDARTIATNEAGDYTVPVLPPGNYQVAVRGIYTRDTHFHESSAPLIFVAMDIRNPMDAAFRRYARATTVRVGLSMGSSISAVVSVEVLIALGRLLKALAAAFKRLSPAAQLLILAGVGAVVLHPKSRAKLQELWQMFQETVRPLLWDGVVDAMYEFAEATKTAEAAHREIEVLLPKARRRSLIAHARAVCLASGQPLSEEMILRKAQTNGYASRNGGSSGYLRRLLRADTEFVESAAGWSIKRRATT